MPLNRFQLNDSLFALDAANVLPWGELNRMNFQKILYFCAVLSPLEDIVWGYDFVNASYGPFNGDLHNAPNMLVQRGYAALSQFRVQKDSSQHARYTITADGKEEVDRICELQIERQRRDWIKLIMKVLDIYGQSVITKLAYKEPTFAQVRRQNKRWAVINLDASENRSLDLIEKLRKTLLTQYSIDLDTNTAKLIAYFDFLFKELEQGV